MPPCRNYITITCEQSEKITEFITNDLQHMEDDEQLVYNEDVIVVKRGKNGIIFKTTTSWVPDFVWFHELLNRYPTFWIKNDWILDTGPAGIWVGYFRNNEPWIQVLFWDDLSVEAKQRLFFDENEVQS